MKALDKLLQDATAGDPITGLKWTRKTSRNLAKELKRQGFRVEHSTLPRLTHLLGYTLRVNHKRLSRKKDERRDEQMKYIKSQRKRFAYRKQPAISVDGKKKEKSGSFGTQEAPCGKSRWMCWRQTFPLTQLGKPFCMACTIFHTTQAS